MTPTTSCPLTKKAFRKEMSYLCIAVSQLPVVDGHRWDIWTDSEIKQHIKLIDNECGVKETTVIESCDLDTFRTKLLQLIQTIGDKRYDEIG